MNPKKPKLPLKFVSIVRFSINPTPEHSIRTMRKILGKEFLEIIALRLDIQFIIPTEAFFNHLPLSIL